MRIALFEPDIPQNAGNIFRLGACLGIPVDIIEPAGFVINDKRLKVLQVAGIYDQNISISDQFNQLESKFIDFDSSTKGQKRL